MEPQTLWLLMLSVVTPIAGVMGFAIQLRQVKKIRLENEKLQLEIAALNSVEAKREQRIVQVTNEEVRRYTRDADAAFSRGSGVNPGAEAHFRSKDGLRNWIAGTSFSIGAIALLTYLAYDIYRLVRWIADAP